MVTHTLPMPPPILPRRKFEPPSGADLEQTRANDRFVAAMLETPFCKPARRSPLDWGVSLVLHIVILTFVVLIPLYYTQSLDLRAFTTTFLVGPPPPPPPAAPPAQKIVRSAPTERLLKSGKLMSPVVIPKQIAMLKEAPISETNTDGVIGGVPGGIPGGSAGGVLGGIIGGAAKSVFASPAPPPPTKRIVQVGGQVKPPRALLQSDPVYPPIARATHVQGTVRIEAIIDEEGNVVQAHVIDGPALLLASALQAVTQWKYQPTLLNGQPVSIQMTVYVNYHLH
jgi:periplasmic protein TonB